MHMFVWIKDAPILDEQTDQEVCDFNDDYVTCDWRAASELRCLLFVSLHVKAT